MYGATCSRNASRFGIDSGTEAAAWHAEIRVRAAVIQVFFMDGEVAPSHRARVSPSARRNSSARVTGNTRLWIGVLSAVASGVEPPLAIASAKSIVINMRPLRIYGLGLTPELSRAAEWRKKAGRLSLPAFCRNEAASA